MSEFEQIQTRKAISAYGGVGSIFETRDGSIMIQPFDKWPFFQRVENDFQEHNFIQDKRFKNRISKYFQNLEHLVKVPVNDLMFGYRLADGFSLLSAKYFPEWFYCNSCKKFDKFSKWKYNWNNNVDSNDKDKFFPPKCHKCYKNKSKKGKFYDLEQVRFILTAPNGDIIDIPWDKWSLMNKTQKESKESEEENEITLSNISVPSDLELEYKTSDKLDDLKGIWIIAKNGKGEQLNFSTLSGLFNLRMRIEELIPNSSKKDILFKPVIRTSNSVYYPNILSSIYLPSADELNENTINQIKDAFEDGENATQIKKNLKRYKFIDIEVKTIQNLIDNNFSERDVEISKTENEYRFDEYKFVTSREKEKIDDLLIFEKIDETFFQNELIKSIYKMDKIKITSVQTSFTRQEPISSDLFLKDDSEITETKDKIQKKFTSTYGVNTKYLPAVESYGEGIFFEFDNEKLEKWLEDNPQVSNRINTIIENHLESDSSLNKELEVTPKFILIHTFSHLIIKELEYLAGYPATSIQERLYIDEELKMQGVLIYTIAGSEGSYGGLTSICDNEKIGNLIQSAIIRANDCATDPICYHTSGQGVGNQNLSACFNCTLLPETSCEMFNSFLDRRILIDKEYGYFRSINNVK
ncbi:MAG: DUF1998 domain-containing protein [Bacteroidales bacterium]|nr:DUF1998 domain-containing protein [Bacteroidales bacterium]